MTRTTVLALGLSTFGYALPAAAFVLDFENITNNNAVDAATAGQYRVDVSDAGSGVVRFDVKNLGPAASSITDVYFESELGDLLAPPMQLIDADDGTGGLSTVDYSPDASPGNLPGAPADFQSLSSLRADSDPPVTANGVQPGEFLGILFNLVSGKTFADLEAAMSVPNDLRIGIHVQGFSSGGSESFLTTGITPEQQVPLPATALLLLAGLAGLAGLRRARGV